MDKRKLERQFRDAVKSSGLVKDEDLDYAVGFQEHAEQQTGRRYSLDRILLRFGALCAGGRLLRRLLRLLGQLFRRSRQLPRALLGHLAGFS